MERLGARDLAAVLTVAGELGTVDDVAGFRVGVLTHLRRLVRCDIASYNEVSPLTHEALVAAVDPPDAVFDGADEIFAAHAHQNPLVVDAQRARTARVTKFSDFLTPRELHRLDLYDLVYAPLEVEHQIALTLPSSSARVIGLALNRRRPDFSERDRAVLQVVQPFVVQAYDHAVARTLARAALAALQSGRSGAAKAVLVLDERGDVQLASELAATWWSDLAPNGTRGRLPEPLRSWSAEQRRRARTAGALTRPLELRTAGATLTARYVGAVGDGLDAILLSRAAGSKPGVPVGRGLTARESEVVEHVADGLSNVQIARELGVSERTVAKHLERAYAKLGVSSRTAAVARLREA